MFYRSQWREHLELSPLKVSQHSVPFTGDALPLPLSFSGQLSLICQGSACKSLSAGSLTWPLRAVLGDLHLEWGEGITTLWEKQLKTGTGCKEWHQYPKGPEKRLLSWGMWEADVEAGRRSGAVMRTEELLRRGQRQQQEDKGTDQKGCRMKSVERYCQSLILRRVEQAPLPLTRKMGTSGSVCVRRVVKDLQLYRESTYIFLQNPQSPMLFL